MECSLCHGTGWVLEMQSDRPELHLDLIPCLIPDCPQSGQPIRALNVEPAKFNHAVWPEETIREIFTG